MDIAEKIATLKAYHEANGGSFNEQLHRMRVALKDLPQGAPNFSTHSGGIDRSQEFSPVQRPSLVRTI
jgi:hypothetical protein